MQSPITHTPCPIITPWTIIFKRSLQVSSSIGLSMIAQMLSVFIGMIMIAHLGKDALVGSALISTMTGFIFVIGGSFLSSVGIMTAQLFGAKKYNDIGKCLRAGIVLALILSIFVEILLWNADVIFMFFKQPINAVRFAQEYFNVYLIVAPLGMVLLVMRQFLIAVDKQRIIIVMSFIGLFIMTLSSYTLIFGHFGMPKLGVYGFGYSAVIWFIISTIVYITYLLESNYCKQFFSQKMSDFFQWYLVRRLTKIGLPIGVQATSEVLAFSAITIMIGWLGSEELAIQQMVVQYFILLVVPIFALSQASSILVGKAYGAQNKLDIRRYSNALLGICLLLTMIDVLIFVLFPHELIIFYVGHDIHLSNTSLQLAITIFILTGCRLLIDSIIIVKSGSLRGMLDVKFPMMLSVSLNWIIGLPLAG